MQEKQKFLHTNNQYGWISLIFSCPASRTVNKFNKNYDHGYYRHCKNIIYLHDNLLHMGIS